MALRNLISKALFPQALDQQLHKSIATNRAAAPKYTVENFLQCFAERSGNSAHDRREVRALDSCFV